MHLLEIQNLSFRFSGGTGGLSDINLAITPGEFVVLAGQNGSGKTTLLRHMNGLYLPQEGRVTVMGQSTADKPARARRKVGLVFQEPDSQIVGETVWDDVAFGPENLKLGPGEIETRVEESLSAVGLLDRAEQNPHTMSAGEKRRLAIAGVLAMGPDMILFDEPFSNLDHPATLSVLAEIILLHQQGRTILVATHDLEKVLAEASRLIVMEKGRLVLDGPPDRIVSQVENHGVRQPCLTRLGQGMASWLN